MQCWIIQCDVSPQIFRKILYTLRVWLCTCECVWWGAGEGYVLVGSSSWGGGGRREGEGRERGRNLIRFGSPWVCMCNSDISKRSYDNRENISSVESPKDSREGLNGFIRWEWWFKSSPCKLQWTGSPQLLSILLLYENTVYITP